MRFPPNRAGRAAGCRSHSVATRAIIDFVNRIFPSVLNNVRRPVRFRDSDRARPCRIRAKSCAGLVRTNRSRPREKNSQRRNGAVMKRDSSHDEFGNSVRRVLALSDWSQVAVLCPRKNWLLEIERELVEEGLPVQLHSSNEKQGDRTAAAWLTALIWVAAHPEDSFEIAGVLREIFGVSDSDMALYTSGDGDRLRLDRPGPAGDGPVETALRILHEACARADAMPAASSRCGSCWKRRFCASGCNSIPEMVLENAGRRTR